MSWIGQRVRAIDWEAKTSGSERFAGDVRLDGLLVGRILRSPHAHARIASINTLRAQTMPGVHAVVTSQDFLPGAMYEHSGGDLRDRPPLAVGMVRYIGEEVAAVAAESAEQADRALAAIAVTYERLPAAFDVASALARRGRLHDRPRGPNLAWATSGTWGDLDSARAAAVDAARGRFVYPRVAHAPMEPNTTVARWDRDAAVMEVWTSSQSPWYVADEMSRTLGIPFEQIVCHDVSSGGGFGSKSHISEHEVIAAALARASNRPVMVQLSRTEEFAATKPRHAFEVEAAAHADRHGGICLFECSITADNGAYNHYGPSVVAAAVKKFGSIYRPLAATWDAKLVDTALTPGGQFRGYGGPQAVFAIESLVDELAHRIGRDPIDLRIANANRPGTTALSGIHPGSARLVECLQTVRTEIDWDRKRAEKVPWHGVGVAAAVHGSGAHVMADANRSEAEIGIDDQGRIEVRFGGADAGTGQRTILAQVAAQELGVDIEDVTVTLSDLSVFDLGAWSSRGTHMSAHAVRQCAAELADRLRTLAADKLGCEPAAVQIRGGEAVHGDERIPLGDLVALEPDLANGRLAHRSAYRDQRMELATGNPAANYSASYAFAAHGVEVEIDPDTGVVVIVDYVAAHDVGRALNPTMVEGQIIGGVVQGIGAALREELLYEGGRLVNGTYVNYPLARAPDVPIVRPYLVEGPEPAGPYDAKGVGEIPILPPPAAIANAIYDAIGVRFREIPITPDKVLNALRQRTRGRRSFSLWRRPSRWQIEAFRRAYPLGLKRALEAGTRWARRTPDRDLVAVHRPAEVKVALEQLSVPGALPVGGATDVIVQQQQRLVSPSTLVSLSGLPGLRRLERTPNGGGVIGAAVTLAELERPNWLPPIIRSTVESIASSQIRAAATVGGNLLQAKRCWYFRNGFDCYKRGGWTCPCYAVTGDHRFYHAALGAHRCQAVTPSDLATTFSALDAVALVRSPGGERRVPMAVLYRGPGESSLSAGEILQDVELPSHALVRVGSFHKLGLWHGDFAVVSVALTAIVTDEWLHDVRCVFGALAPTPWRSTDVERALEGRRTADLEPDAVSGVLDRHLDRVGHPLPGNAWKLDAAAGLLRKAVHELTKT